MRNEREKPTRTQGMGIVSIPLWGEGESSWREKILMEKKKGKSCRKCIFLHPVPIRRIWGQKVETVEGKTSVFLDSVVLLEGFLGENGQFGWKTPHFPALLLHGFGLG